MENKPTNDILDIVFYRKNKEYGAYVLRKRYARNLTISLLVAIILFVLSISSPLIIAYLKPKEDVKAGTTQITIAQLADIPQQEVKEDAPPPPQVEAPPLESTVKFTVPIVRPDAEVADEYVPTVEELKEADPGKKTQEGNPNATFNEDAFDITDDIREEEKVVVEDKVEKPQVFTYVEEMPSFPGGQDAMMQFVTSNIQYPEIAKKAGVEGKVFVSFVVGRDGAISGVQVVKGIGAGCDEEAMKVIRKMPKWSPGRQNGQPVHVQVSIPIFFKLQ